MRFCSNCGSSVQGGSFCLVCGAKLSIHPPPLLSAPPPLPPPLSTRTSREPAHGKRSKLVPWFLGIAVVLVTSVIGLDRLASTLPPKLSQLPSDDPKQAPRSAKALPPLHIVTTGKLPIVYQGLSLGMSVAEAMSVRPQLEKFSGGKPDQEDYRGGLYDSPESRHLSNMPQIDVDFKDGRADYISAELNEVSPSDAKQLEDHTVNFLGQPDVTHSLPILGEVSHVWVDGDVRLRFKARRLGSDYSRFSPYSVELTFAAYPIHLRNWEEESAKEPLGKLSVEMFKQSWADASADEPVRKVVPRQIGGMRLGMSLQEVRQALGVQGASLDIRTAGEDYSDGSQQLPDGSDFLIAFLRGKLATVIYENVGLDENRWMPELNTLTERYGTPARWVSAGASIGTWVDDHTDLMFTLSIPDEKTGRRRISWNLRDLDLVREHESDGLRKLPTYKTDLHLSFF